MGSPDTCHRHTQTSRARSPCVRDSRVVTYRYHERMVYVTPADTYEKAIAYAKSAFPEDLRPIPASQLSLTVLSNTPRGKRTVYISPMAWNAVSNNLATYEIIDIVVKPPVIVLNDNQEPELPPDYDDLCMPDTKTPYSYPYPNDASPKSRRPSPGRRSPSPSAKSGVKGWLERILP